MGQIVQYGNISVKKFLNANFDVDDASEIIIRKVNLDSDQDNIVFSFSRPTAEKNTAAGSKLLYSTPGGESKMTINFYEDPDRSVYNELVLAAYPEAFLRSDGKIEYNGQPGIDYTDYKNLRRITYTPVDAEEIEDTSNQIIIPRAAIVIEEQTKFGQPNTMPVMFMGQGGLRLASLISTADLSTDIDLSAGGTDKLVGLEINGKKFDVNFGQSATTSQAAIILAINTAVGSTVAIANGDFIELTSEVFGAPIVVTDPSSGTSGLTLVFGFTERTLVKGIDPLIIK